MVLHATVVLGSLILILASSAFFTNAIEWLGIRLGVKEGAVGSLLAALGTAMPEILIPLVAILAGTRGGSGAAIGIGAILGAPFMLSTAALAMAGASGLLFARRRGTGRLYPDPRPIRRDLGFFLVAWTLVIGSTFIPRSMRLALPPLLLAAYVGFVWVVLSRGRNMDWHQMSRLFFARRTDLPPTGLILLQLIVSFAGITFGVRYFVTFIESLAGFLRLPVLLFSLLVAPLASESPELFNSVLWIGQKKDTLALGNITGAMVLQSSVAPIVGLAFTSWVLPPLALAAAFLTLLTAGSVFLFVSRRGHLSGVFLLALGGLFYLSYLGYVIKTSGY
ncbi:MAG: sodium:calcium antiporter [Peptococcaceae bacterium]|jgi:cation:H+ antiporter|nr:sodium:calcium antiporter [Peptococcaceae bacterium]